jgi:hypothetical protein
LFFLFLDGGFRGAFEFDANVRMIVTEGNDVQAEDFSGEVGSRSGFLERGNLVERVEIWGYTEPDRQRRVPEEMGGVSTSSVTRAVS